MLIGFWTAGKIADYFTISEGVHNWESIWLYPAGFALVVMFLFAFFFKNEEIEYKT
jgi:hypothetical protein